MLSLQMKPKVTKSKKTATAKVKRTKGTNQPKTKTKTGTLLESLGFAVKTSIIKAQADALASSLPDALFLSFKIKLRLRKAALLHGAAAAAAAW